MVPGSRPSHGSRRGEGRGVRPHDRLVSARNGWGSASGSGWEIEVHRGRKCKGYETNSSKGELAALHYAVEKFSKWLQLGSFLVLSDNSTCVHWQTMEVKGGGLSGDG